jgi:hypothetical protein
MLLIEFYKTRYNSYFESVDKMALLESNYSSKTKVREAILEVYANGHLSIDSVTSRF